MLPAGHYLLQNSQGRSTKLKGPTARASKASEEVDFDLHALLESNNWDVDAYVSRGFDEG